MYTDYLRRMVMWEFESKINTKATEERIWKLWSEVTKWKDWDVDIIQSEILGEFALGTKGNLKPKLGPKAHFTIIEITPKKSFTTRTSLPFCKIDFIHFLQLEGKGLKITHRIEMIGALSRIFGILIGSQAKKNLPVALNNLIRIAEGI